MLFLNGINKSFGEKIVLKEVKFHISPGEKIGLIGVNGSGKTTLLKIISGENSPDSGSVKVTGDRPVTYMSQEVTVLPQNTLQEEMEKARPELKVLKEEIDSLENRMNNTADSSYPEDSDENFDNMVTRYTNLLDKFQHMGGNDLSWKIARIIQGLGFSLDDLNRPAGVFSGGWQMRMELAKLLLQEGDLLLLDEPTNHLDIHAVEWLEDYLRSYPGAVLIVSHDRYFLNRVTTATLHLNRGEIRYFPGNYEFFTQKLAQELEQQEKAYKNQQDKLRKDMRFIERFRAKATLATRVKSREKMLERMEIIEKPLQDSKSIKVAFNSDGKQLATVYKMHDLEKEYPDKMVPLKGEMEISGGERIAVVGENGCGKTTLLRILAGIDRRYTGKISTHPNAKIGFYHQNQAEELEEGYTVLEEMEKVAPPDLTTTRLRTILGSFLFREDDVFKQIEVLSGGEKSRLALARMVCSPFNVLLLDEPTNHLDFESREALAKSLEDYEGTVIAVSHDRYFIDQICDRTIEIEEGRLLDYPGNYSYYRQKKEENRKKKFITEAEKPEKKSSAPKNKKKKKKDREIEEAPQESTSSGNPFESIPKARLEMKIFQTECEISRMEEEMESVEKQMENPDFTQNRDNLEDLITQYSRLRAELDDKYQKWEQMHEAFGENA